MTRHPDADALHLEDEVVIDLRDEVDHETSSGAAKTPRWRRPDRPTWPSRIWSTLLALAFVLPLCAPGVLMLLGARPGLVDNREPTAMPELDDLLRLDVDALTDLQSWFRDRLPGLDVAIEADARVELSILDQSPNPKVVLGEDGWLFLNQTIEQACLDEAAVAEVDERFDVLRRAAREGGRQVVLLVIPDKAAVHPDRLRPADRARSCARANAQALAEGLSDRNVIVPLDLLDARAARGEATYHGLDTHWADQAAHEVVELLVRHLGLQGDDAELAARGARRVPQDLRLLQGITTKREDACHVMRRPGVEVEGHRQDCIFPANEVLRTTATTSGRTPLLPSTTFVYDSFGLRMLEVMPAWFGRLDAVYKPDKRGEDPSPSVVDTQVTVIQVVQRRLPSLLGDDELLAALAEALATPRSS